VTVAAVELAGYDNSTYFLWDPSAAACSVYTIPHTHTSQLVQKTNTSAQYDLHMKISRCKSE